MKIVGHRNNPQTGKMLWYKNFEMLENDSFSKIRNCWGAGLREGPAGALARYGGAVS